LTLDPSVVAAALVTVIVALSASIVAILSKLGENAKAARADAGAIAIQIATIAAKTDVIEGHVNSAATRNAAIIAAQETQLAMLREQIGKLEATALLLAQAKAVRAVDTVTGETLAVHDTWEKDERAKATAAIEENTALTREIRDAVVAKVEP
jgi:hypothetical protein